MAAAKSRVIDRDHGWIAELRHALKISRKPHVTIGIHSKEGIYRPGQGSVTVLQYASFSEFGTRRIPERPFMRHTFDRHQAKYTRIMGRLGKQVLDGTLSELQALEVAGMTAAADVQNSIARSKTWAKPNAPATVRAKGSSTPLIDTGRMRQSIRHVVHAGTGILPRKALGGG